MKRYKLFVVGSLVLSTTFAFGQQSFQFGNYTHNPYLFNPAAAGMNGLTQIDLGYRNQHISSDGNPVTMYASGSTEIYGKKSRSKAPSFNSDKVMMYTPPLNEVGLMKQVVGGKVVNDAIGPFQQTSILATYGIHIPINKKSNLGAGIGMGWNNFGINSSKIILRNQFDNVVDDFGGKWSQNKMDLQAGLVYYTNRLTVSVSATNLLSNKLHIGHSSFDDKLNTQWMFYSSYKWNASTDFLIEPFVMLREVKNAPISIDFGSRFQYKYIWLGAQYRTTNTFIVSFGLNLLRNFYLSYGFEYSAANTRISNAGTHEVQIGVYIGRKVKKSAETTPIQPDSGTDNTDD